MSSSKTSSLPQKPPNHSSINSTPTNAMSLEITQKWFALYVKAHHEKVVDRALHRVGFDSFLPLYFSIIILMFLVYPCSASIVSRFALQKIVSMVGLPIVSCKTSWFQFHLNAAGPLSVTWSVAIEEQFYIVWAWVVRYCSQIQIRL